MAPESSTRQGRTKPTGTFVGSLEWSLHFRPRSQYPASMWSSTGGATE
jgi:hypothetical protein